MGRKRRPIVSPSSGNCAFRASAVPRSSGKDAPEPSSATTLTCAEEEKTTTLINCVSPAPSPAAVAATP